MKAIETSIDSEGVKITTIHLKRRINHFYTDNDDGNLAYALYEDIEGNIHYRYCNCDTDDYKMCASCFEREFSRLEV